jgi:hypothetical protein
LAERNGYGYSAPISELKTRETKPGAHRNPRPECLITADAVAQEIICPARGKMMAAKSSHHCALYFALIILPAS